MKFFSQKYPQKWEVSKNVQNYKKTPIYQKTKTLKNYNFNRIILLMTHQNKPMFAPFIFLLQKQHISSKSGVKNLDLDKSRYIFVQKWVKNHRFGQKLKK